MLETKLKEYIRKLVQEMDEELEEITTTANIDGFDTPYAFLNKKSKKDKEKRKRTATMMGYTIVGEGKSPGCRPPPASASGRVASPPAWSTRSSPAMTTTASAVDRVDYVVKSTDVIHAVVSLDVKATS